MLLQFRPMSMLRNQHAPRPIHDPRLPQRRLARSSDPRWLVKAFLLSCSSSASSSPTSPLPGSSSKASGSSSCTPPPQSRKHPPHSASLSKTCTSRLTPPANPNSPAGGFPSAHAPAQPPSSSTVPTAQWTPRSPASSPSTPPTSTSSSSTTAASASAPAPTPRKPSCSRTPLRPQIPHAPPATSSPSQIILYGQGIGASLALNTCATTNIDFPALILENADGDLQPRVAHDPRARFLPTRLLFHEALPARRPLTTSQAAKLFLTTGTSTATTRLSAVRTRPQNVRRTPLTPNDPAIFPAIHRFLDDIPTTQLITHNKKRRPPMFWRPSIGGRVVADRGSRTCGE